MPIVSYVTYATGDELLELLFRSSGVTIFEHWEPLFEPNPITGTIFRVQKQVGRTHGRTDARTDIHTSILLKLYTIGPAGN